MYMFMVYCRHMFGSIKLVLLLVSTDSELLEFRVQSKINIKLWRVQTMKTVEQTLKTR